MTNERIKELASWLVKGKLAYEWFKLKDFRVESSPAKEILEELCVPHNVEQQYIVLEPDNAYALLSTLGILENNALSMNYFESVYSPSKEPMELINELCRVEVRRKAPTYIGARMGRPEKARERMMKPAPQVLFPVSGYGGKIRSLLRAYRESKSLEGKGMMMRIARMRCPACGEVGIYSKCGKCGNRTFVERVCGKCNKVQNLDICSSCKAPTFSCDERPVDLAKLMDEAVRKTGGHMPEDIKGVKGMTSEMKIPEILEKGILRAKHNVVLFKDGTCRFDATDMVLTHFYPKEVGVSVEKLRTLGYNKDYLGNELKSEDQLVELKQQDVLLSENGGEFLKNVAGFIDDLLVYVYNLKPYYGLSSRGELIGHLVIALSPHTSCGVLGRIVGFTKAHVGYAHPYMISARRRNADGDEDSLMLLMDGLLNFSRKFLPESRGGTMDAPLILTKVIDPKEVDDEAHCMEVCSNYPLEFYEATLRFASPGEVKIERVDDRLGKESQYQDLRFTHGASSIHNAPVKTKYVELKSMKEKIEAQFSLGEKIRAVNIKDAAERLVLSHFLPDLYGNLRSFSRQEFRCVDCNLKYRRVPLLGKCRKCGGKLLLTINKGGIEKYLRISQEIVDKYDLPIYLKQRLALIEKDIKSIFEDETSRQFNLAEFM